MKSLRSPLPLGFLLALLSLATLIHAGERVEILLNDNSRVFGETELKEIPFEFLGVDGKTSVDLVQRLEMRDDQMVMHLTNGDEVSSAQTLTTFPANTLIGEVAIPMAVCKRIDFVDRSIRVKDAASFLKAIQSNRTILVEPGKYDLTKVAIHNEVIGRTRERGFLVRGVTNLKIIGQGDTPPEIVVSPNLSDTLTFADGDGIHLENLSFGHRPAAVCMGGVLRFDRCGDVTVDDCDLFGCGTVGVTAKECVDLTVTNSVIRDCTSGLFSASGCKRLRVVDCRFLRNQCFNGFAAAWCNDVLIADCAFTNNKGSGKVPLFAVGGAKTVVARGLQFEKNQGFEGLVAKGGKITFEDGRPAVPWDK